MADYIPPTLDWLREQVELYESSGGTQGNTLLDTGMPYGFAGSTVPTTSPNPMRAAPTPSQ